ncbi:MAG: hypothetical protein HY680_00115 [Chloroflexi bacterium]|nr:hypothetical protein [Chloroflexota bacterium]
MTILNIKQEIVATPQVVPETPTRERVRQPFAELDLPSFIGQVLGQFQDLLVHQVEDEVRSKALAAVKEQSRTLHYQARERLRVVESDVQQRFQSVLERAQERIFEVIQEEMEATFTQVEASFQSLVDDAGRDLERRTPPPANRRLQRWPVEQQSDPPLPIVTPAEPLPLQETKPSERADPDGSNANVCLELPPPLSSKALMAFYQGLSHMKEVQVLQVTGSVDKGVAVYLRPRQVFSLPPLLQVLPGVKEVGNALPSSVAHKAPRNNGSADSNTTFRILLAPTS